MIIIGKRDQNKFFSNGTLLFYRVRNYRYIHIRIGLDYANATKDYNFFPGVLNLEKRVLKD